VGAAEIIPTRHNVAWAHEAPEDMPADLLRAAVVLVLCDGQMLHLEPLYDGPYLVLTRSRDYFRLQIGDSLKPCTDSAAAPAALPRRGHPLGQRKDVTFC
jgi:hypothetical protein